MSKKKNKKPPFRSRHQGIAFQRHEFQRLRRRAEQAVKRLEEENPDGADEFKEEPRKLIEAFGELLARTDWRTVRYDLRVIARYVEENPPPTEDDDEKVAAYVDRCLDAIIDEQARAWLTTIGLGVQVQLVEEEAYRLGWVNLFLLNMLGNHEAKPHTIPLLHNLFWASYNDYLFQRNVQAFIGRVLDPDLQLEAGYREALEADWAEAGLEPADLAAKLDLDPEKVVESLAETGRLVRLAEEKLQPLFPTDEAASQAGEQILAQAVDIVRAAQDNRSRSEEIDAAAAGVLRQLAAARGNDFQSSTYLEELEEVLADLEENGAELVARLAATARRSLPHLPPRLNPLFDALFFAGVRLVNAREFAEAQAQAEAQAAQSGDDDDYDNEDDE